MASATGPTPTSWRDVYDLVRDTRSDVLEAVTKVDGKVDTLDEKFQGHLLNHAEKRGEEQGRGQMLGMGRNAVVTIIAITSGIASVVSVAGDAILTAITGGHH